jgi:hypothetical protein
MRVTIDTEKESMMSTTGGAWGCLVTGFLIPAIVCFCFGAHTLGILLLVPTILCWLIGAFATNFGQDTEPHDTPCAINPRDRIPRRSRLYAEETEIHIRHRAANMPSRAGEVVHVYPRRACDPPHAAPQRTPSVPSPALMAPPRWRKVPQGAPRPQYFDFGSANPKPPESDTIDWSKLG